MTQYSLSEVKQSIKFLNNWIKDDLHELNGDATSDYALWILENHKNINVAIKMMENYIEMFAYQE